MVKGNSFLSFVALGVKWKEVTFEDAVGDKRLLGEPQCLCAPLAESMKRKRFDNNNKTV